MWYLCVLRGTEEEGFDWEKDDKVILFTLVNYVLRIYAIVLCIVMVPS